jgi:phospholipase C
MDAWVAAKDTDRTMDYLARADIPFHYALADAYPILDAYHCSVLSATGPNRTYPQVSWILRRLMWVRSGGPRSARQG